VANTAGAAAANRSAASTDARFFFLSTIHLTLPIHTV
jgi:hypothetical protein